MNLSLKDEAVLRVRSNDEGKVSIHIEPGELTIGDANLMAWDIYDKYSKELQEEENGNAESVR